MCASTALLKQFAVLRKMPSDTLNWKIAVIAAEYFFFPGNSQRSQRDVAVPEMRSLRNAVKTSSDTAPKWLSSAVSCAQRVHAA
jgi:hypothetical protein